MKNNTNPLQLFVLGILLYGLSFGVYAADLASPVVLVATDRLGGSPYEETVVLVVPSGDGQHLGLIVNRPTTIKLTSVFPNTPSAVNVTEPLFFGGPVMSDSLFAAIRATQPPSNYSVALLPGLFLVTDEDGVNQVINATPEAARYFTGFIVWGENELAGEIQRGMWDTQFADANVLFRSNPQQLWLELARNKSQVAQLK